MWPTLTFCCFLGINCNGIGFNFAVARGHIDFMQQIVDGEFIVFALHIGHFQQNRVRCECDDDIFFGRILYAVQSDEQFHKLVALVPCIVCDFAFITPGVGGCGFRCCGRFSTRSTLDIELFTEMGQFGFDALYLQWNCINVAGTRQLSGDRIQFGQIFG